MDSGRFSGSDDPLGGGAQALGSILAIATLVIPLFAVLSFSNPPPSSLSPPLSLEVTTSTADAAAREIAREAVTYGVARSDDRAR